MNKLKVKNLLTIFITLLAAVQILYAGERRLYNINQMWGTSDRMITSMVQDDYGFVYGASKMGVIRITDDDYHEYPSPFRSGIHMATLINTPIGMYLWGNDGEVFRYDQVLDTFVPYCNIEDHIDGFRHILNDVTYHDGALWGATSDGLIRITGDEARIEPRVAHSTHMLASHNGRLYYDKEGDLYSLDTAGSAQPVLVGKGNPSFDLSTLYVDADEQRMLIGTSYDGLWTVPLNAKGAPLTQAPVDINKPIRSIQHEDDQTLLIGTDGSGIIIVNDSTLTPKGALVSNIDDHFSLRGNGVYTLLKDRGRERIWVSTYTDGISYYDKCSTQSIRNIRHIANKANSLSNNNVNSVLEDASGMIWFGTDAGADRWDQTNNVWTHYPLSQNGENTVVLDICQTTDGNIWLGTYSKGVFILDSRSGAIKRHIDNIDGHPCLFVFDIYQDYYGEVWIGCNSGYMFRYNPSTDTFKAVGIVSVNDIMEPQMGEIVLTSPNGLLKVDRNTNQITTLYDQGQIIQDCVYVDGVYWMGTVGHGLLRFDPATGSVEAFTTANGLPSDYINSLFYIKGRIMVATEKGMCQFNIADHSMHTFLENQHRTRVSFNANAVSMLSSGQIIWGSSDGAYIYSPLTSSPTTLQGRIFMQDMLVNGSTIKDNPEIHNGLSVNAMETLVLKHDQNNLKLEFVAVNLRGGQYVFSWRMDGIDPEWISEPEHNIATYSNLPPGTYTFSIRLYDASHSKVLDQRDISITVRPPFWRTWWAMLLFALILGGITYIIIRMYKHTLRQEQNEEKIRFFTNIAHDIRTSLTLIKAPLEALHKDRALTEQSAYYVGLARQQSSLLSTVTTQLLDFEKVDSDRGQLVVSPHDIVAVISRRVSMYDAMAAQRQLTMTFTSDIDRYVTSVDLLKVEKVIDNLITNAIKYTRAGGKVDVSFGHDDKGWSLTVSDTGIGIPERAQKKLFREFYRGENAVNSGVVGSGIGLLVTKKFVEMHNGVITFTSREGEGTTFTVTIPMMHGGEAADLRQAQSAEPTIASIGNELPPQPTDGDTDAPTDDGDDNARRRILIVEDNANLRGFLAQVFGDEYTVLTAANGREGWEMAQSMTPDLIISDVMMPEMDGMELCRRLKSTFETAHIPLILLTSLSDKTRELEGLRLGADAYITKPFDITTLSTRIDTMMKNREVVRQYYTRATTTEPVSEPTATAPEPQDDVATPEAAPEQASPMQNEHNDRFLKKAVETVNKHIADPDFGKDAFASDVCVSPSLLYKKLKALTGQSPTDFIKNIRLERAMTLLTTTSHTITEISEMCGFSSVTYFGVAFKRHYGMSPSESRKDTQN